MALDREQQSIVRTLLAEGQKIRDPSVRRKYERAAVQTGLVESGLRNLGGGDADSAGWRQERASLYSNPTSVKDSARRFRQEFEQHYDPGEKSYEVAAQVQRPREDLRGRYKDEAGKAAAILRSTTGGAPAPSSGGTRTETTTTTQQAAAPEVGSSVLAQQLAQSLQRTGRPSASAPAAPAFAAKVSTAGAPIQSQPRQTGGGGTLQAKLDEAASTQGVDVPTTSDATVKSIAGSPAKSKKGGANSAFDWAASKVGFKETGTNAGGIASYANKRFGMSNQAWCAMFTSLATTKGGAPKEARTASVAQVLQKAQNGEGYQRGFVDQKRAKKGDLITFGTNHIGMVERVEGNRIVMVAGNDSNGVQRRAVPIGRGDVRIVRPKYGSK